MFNAGVLSTTVGVVAFGLWALGQEKPEPKSDKEEKEATQVVLLGSAKYEVPIAWKKRDSNRQFRVAEYVLPAAEGDKDASELIVYHFGKGQGGSVEANITRWKGQFRERAKEDKLEKIKAAGMELTVLDMTGTYLFRAAPVAQEVTPREGYRMLNAIVPLPEDGPYFFRLVGPEKSITAQVDNFKKMLKSVRPE